MSIWALAPNQQGFEKAMQSQVDGISLFTATSETFAKKNVNRNLKELDQFLKSCASDLLKSHKRNRVYLSTIAFCPYEGVVKKETVLRSVDRLVELGFSEIVLSDTTGHAHPSWMAEICEKILKKHRADLFSLHLHDTRALALVNIWEAIKHGICRFDSAIGGSGGCPYAPGASGNLATEDLCNLILQTKDADLDIDLNELVKAGELVEKYLERTLPSKVLRAMMASHEISKN